MGQAHNINTRLQTIPFLHSYTHSSSNSLSHTAIMAESPARSGAELVTNQTPDQQAESDLASLVFEMSQQVQMGMENMLKLVNEIDQNSVGIKEEIEKSKDYAMEKKRVLEEEKEQFQKAAYTILDMLSNRG